MAAITWNRESSQGLFDYDNSNVTKSAVKLETPATLVRTGHVVCSAKECLSLPVQLAEVEVVDGHVCLSPCSPLPAEQAEKLWLAVKPLRAPNKIRGYRLAEGDVIKVGRVKFRVKELNSYTEQNIAHFSMDEMIHEESSESEEEQAEAHFELPCRVCLREDYDQANPLISPCNCGGTMKYIHLRCLQKFLKSRLSTRSTETTLSISWKKISCDLCKKRFPYKLVVDRRTVELLEIPKPPGRYVILEGLCREAGAYKGLHVISFHNKDRIQFGRSNECELKLSDISVSRLHAIIKYVSGHFYIEDTRSKFGTLIQVKRPIVLEQYSPVTVQTGRTLMVVSYKQRWSFIPGCFRPQVNVFERQVREASLFPVGTGIPLSIAEKSVLRSRTGVIPRQGTQTEENNLFYQHNQLGMNSSYEEEEEEELAEVESVEVAESVEIAESIEVAVSDSFPVE